MRIGTNSAALPALRNGVAAAKSPRERFNDTVKLTAAGSSGTAVGYGLGAVVGAVAYNAGGNYAYALMGPAAGALIGGMTGVAAQTNSKAWGNVALASGLASAGCLAGDALGHGLTLLTGNSLYQAVGAATGALNGAAIASNFFSGEANSKFGKAAEYTTLALGGSTVGATLGCLTGSLISYVTGNHLYTSAAPILGALAGGLTGLAVDFQKNSKTEEK